MVTVLFDSQDSGGNTLFRVTLDRATILVDHLDVRPTPSVMYTQCIRGIGGATIGVTEEEARHYIAEYIRLAFAQPYDPLNPPF